ncbi:MAG: hypothetical protein WBY94_25255, partial [Polyangiaceae bacterium]
ALPSLCGRPLSGLVDVNVVRGPSCAVAKKYPHRAPRQILEGLAKTTPGEEGDWFGAAKEFGL